MVAQTRVWDLPTRLFHWLLVILCTTSVITVQIDELEWHERSGIAILILVISRAIWGVCGSETARFSHFVKGPAAIINYVRGLFAKTEVNSAGHNPVGALVVLAFFVLLITQAITGLFANDEIVFEGPLADLVSRDMSDTLTSLHHTVAEALLWLVGLHVLANIGYWLVLKQNLIVPMITGRKIGDDNDNATLYWRSSWLALLILCVIAAVIGVTIGYR
ncbi:MAG: cytochrome b/b6 domain-containing protein [Gammaproteobacteria bacterium]